MCWGHTESDRTEQLNWTDWIWVWIDLSCSLCDLWRCTLAQTVKNLPARQETWVRSLSQEGPLEKKMATHSSILAWKIPWTEAPSGLQSRASHTTGRACMHCPFSSLDIRVFISWVSVKILMVKNPGLLVHELLTSHTGADPLASLWRRLLSVCNTALGHVLPPLYPVSSPELESLEPLCLNRERRGDGWRWWSEQVCGVNHGSCLGDRGHPARSLVSTTPLLLLKTVFTFLFMATPTAHGILVLTRDRTHAPCTNFTEWSF